jgi:hypothetical protein
MDKMINDTRRPPVGVVGARADPPGRAPGRRGPRSTARRPRSVGRRQAARAWLAAPAGAQLSARL